MPRWVSLMKGKEKMRDEKTGRDDYEQRKQARIDSLYKKAERLEAESKRAFKRSDDLLAPIPLGQPILVGHHSEKRHRNTLKKSDQAMRRGIEKDKEAKRTRGRAIAAEENCTISSDDPNAIPRLEARIKKEEQRRDLMKRANQAYRAFKKNPAVLDNGNYADLPNTLKDKIRTWEPPYSFVKNPFEPYVFSNLGANIRRMRQRIESLGAESVRESVEPIQGNGFKIEERPDLNRITVLFDQKPDRETCKKMRSGGWRWSPKEGAWMRHLNNAGRFAAETLLEVLK